jgi:hypothetical protein
MSAPPGRDRAVSEPPLPNRLLFEGRLTVGFPAPPSGRPKHQSLNHLAGDIRLSTKHTGCRHLLRPSPHGNISVFKFPSYRTRPVMPQNIP